MGSEKGRGDDQKACQLGGVVGGCGGRSHRHGALLRRGRHRSGHDGGRGRCRGPGRHDDRKGRRGRCRGPGRHGDRKGRRGRRGRGRRGDREGQRGRRGPRGRWSRGRRSRQRAARPGRSNAAARREHSAVRQRTDHALRVAGRRDDAGDGCHARVSTEGASGAVLPVDRPLRGGHVPLGIQHQRGRPDLAGSHDRGAAGHGHHRPVFERARGPLPPAAPLRRSDDPLGRPSSSVGQESVHRRGRERRRPLHRRGPGRQRRRPRGGRRRHHRRDAERRPGRMRRAVLGGRSGRAASPRRRGPFRVRRPPRFLVYAGRHAQGTGIRQHDVRLPESTRSHDAVVSRSLPGHHAAERLLGPRGVLFDPRRSRHGPRE